MYCKKLFHTLHKHFCYWKLQFTILLTILEFLICYYFGIFSNNYTHCILRLSKKSHDETLMLDIKNGNHRINFNFVIDSCFGKKDSTKSNVFYVVVKCQKIFDKPKMLLQFMSFKTRKRIKSCFYVIEM